MPVPGQVDQLAPLPGQVSPVPEVPGPGVQVPMMAGSLVRSPDCMQGTSGYLRGMTPGFPGVAPDPVPRGAEGGRGHLTRRHSPVAGPGAQGARGPAPARPTAAIARSTTPEPAYAPTKALSLRGRHATRRPPASSAR